MQKSLSQLLPAFKHRTLALDGATPVDFADVANVPINSLAFDSRDVKEGALFFALPGTHADGNEYVAQAIERGANAVVYQGEIPRETRVAAAKALARRALGDALGESVPRKIVVPAFIKVDDARAAMSPVADTFYDSPSKKLYVIGVTGTEGKSSVVSFIWQLLKALGKKAGFISTVEYSFGDEAIPNPQHQTTPEAPITQHHLNAMLENGCSCAVVEASSHGLSALTNRLGDVQFDCAVFMNVTLEHLEFHKTFERYRDDKANLFRSLDSRDHVKVIAGMAQKVPSFGVVNLDDESALYVARQTRRPVCGFSASDLFSSKENSAGEVSPPLQSASRFSASPTNGGKAPVTPQEADDSNDGFSRMMRATNIKSTGKGLSFTMEADGASAHELMACEDGAREARGVFSANVEAPLPGAFNALNLMAAALAVSGAARVPFARVAEQFPNLVPVKGRMTAIDKGQPFEVIVDYAHTPSSFMAILPPIRERCAGRLFALFGSGGERDRTKRPLQGQTAARFCDVIFLADEDPRGEDPMGILREIAAGALKEGKKEGENLLLIPDRPQAIRAAFKMALENDIVLLLGKAHENSIIGKDGAKPYDEISEAERALSEMGWR